MQTTSGPIRAVVAAGVAGTGVVVATDSAWLAHDIENMSDEIDDIGLDHPPGPGVWLWEGSGKLAPGGPADEPGEQVPEYAGRYRAVEPHELAGLLALEPPEECAVCGKPAAGHYPDADGEPSCGDPRCEAHMQAGLDDIDERG